MGNTPEVVREVGVYDFDFSRVLKKSPFAVAVRWDDRTSLMP